MTLAIGTPVRWSNYPLADRRGTIVEVVMPGRMPMSQLAGGAARAPRGEVSYVVREAGHGRQWWPLHVTVAGPAPVAPPLTEDERRWCEAHPGQVRDAMRRAVQR